MSNVNAENRKQKLLYGNMGTKTSEIRGWERRQVSVEPADDNSEIAIAKIGFSGPQLCCVVLR